MSVPDQISAVGLRIPLHSGLSRPHVSIISKRSVQHRRSSGLPLPVPQPRGAASTETVHATTMLGAGRSGEQATVFPSSLPDRECGGGPGLRVARITSATAMDRAVDITSA